MGDLKALLTVKDGLSGREVIDRFDTFVHPKQLIPAEITELTSITNADVADAPSAVEAVAALADFVGGCPVIAHNATFDSNHEWWCGPPPPLRAR